MVLAAFLAVLAPSLTVAQYPRSRRGVFEVGGLDFRPEGAWRRRASQVRADRHQWLRQGALSRLNGASSRMGVPRVAGRMSVPVIPIAFANVPPPFPAGDYQEVLFAPVPGGSPYTLATFYRQVSNGNLELTGRVVDWVTADSADGYYEDACNGVGVLSPCGKGGVPFGRLLLEALSQASTRAVPGFWAEFDNDGPDGLPNSGDDDGYVDFVTFLQPERDGACPGSPNIWAHRFVIRAWNRGAPFVTRTPWAGHPGEFLAVDDYTIQSAVGGASACDPGEIMPIGTVAHETGHAFGLPDLYDTDLANPAASAGIGEWGLMGSGSYARPYSPARFEAWSLVELGWVAVDTLVAGRTVRLGPVATADTVLLATVPATDEYYLLENRQALESDTAQMSPAFVRPKGPGLMVWHIDQGQVDAHGFRGDNRVNSGPLHGVELLQADGRNDLRRAGGPNRGDAGDPYPGTSANRTLCQGTLPAATDHQGSFAGFCLADIAQEPDGAVGLRFSSLNSVFAAGHPAASIRVDRVLVHRLDRYVPAGRITELSADSVQVGGSGRSRFTFLAWSDGLARDHSVTAGATPDTVIARVEPEHRVRVTVEGAAADAVTADATGDLRDGFFLPEGYQLTLRALELPDRVFTGWRGDTAAGAARLSLRLDRPYDLVAGFARRRLVALDTAAAVLLGAAELDSEARALLDAEGNRNGEFDLGDLLAAERRSGGAGQ